MTFEEQIESLTGLTISSTGTTPTQDEVSQFLKDGIKDVINKLIEISPAETAKFTATTHDAENNGIVITGKSIAIVREHDSTSILRPCTLISSQDRYEATDVDSIKYRSAYNPGYYILDGKIFSVPASASGNNDLIVTQVTYPSTTYLESTIINFPDEFEYLVVIYASMKSLESKMAEYTITEEDSELAQSLGLNIASLGKQYNEGLLVKTPQQERRTRQAESERQ